MPWTGLELTENHLTEDRDAVTPVKSDRGNVEDTSNCSIRTKTDQVNGNCPEDRDPDCINWRLSHWVDLDPDVGERNKAISRECKHCSR